MWIVVIIITVIISLTYTVNSNMLSFFTDCFVCFCLFILAARKCCLFSEEDCCLTVLKGWQIFCHVIWNKGFCCHVATVWHGVFVPCCYLLPGGLCSYVIILQFSLSSWWFCCHVVLTESCPHVSVRHAGQDLNMHVGDGVPVTK